MGNQQYMLGY